MRTLNLLGGLGVSAAAFAALAACFVWTAEATEGARIEPEPVAIEAHAQPEAPASDAPAGIEAEAPAEMEAELEADADAEPAAVEPEFLVTVPDLTGRTALRALRQARGLGLEVEIRDTSGRLVPSYDRLYTRVTEQSVAAGTRIEAGSTILLEGRAPRAAFASGY
ncbi:MAG: PASTA domain-containing protein [Sandaracinaceae bacterium]|nr:PASTA domain-containing protein [Sandaracinaceae bacterium]